MAVPGGGVSAGSGTSYATAVVSGVGALLLSVAQREGYRIDALDIRDILIDSAAPCTLEGDSACDRYLAGTLDAAAALAAVHRAGQSRRAFAGSTPGQPLIGADRVGQQFTHSGTEEIVMSESSSVQSAAVEPSGLSPSACNCERKPDDESTNAKVEQQSTGPVPGASPPLAPVTQGSACALGLTQLACSCGGGEPPQIVFALGALWFDFGTEARYDALVQQLDPIRVNNPTELIAFLRENPQYATGVTFILMQEQIPLYAIQPAGPFAPQIYNAIFDALESSLDEERNREQRVSIPGMIGGSTRLLNGMTVPVVYPDLRGMFKWQSHELIAAAKAAVGSDVAADDHIFNFLNRVYYELRNFGVAPQDRALNFAATNAFQTQVAFAEFRRTQTRARHHQCGEEPDLPAGFRLLGRRIANVRPRERTPRQPGLPLHGRRERNIAGHGRHGPYLGGSLVMPARRPLVHGHAAGTWPVECPTEGRIQRLCSRESQS